MMIDIKNAASSIADLVKTSVDYFKNLRSDDSGYKMKYDFSLPKKLLQINHR